MRRCCCTTCANKEEYGCSFLFFFFSSSSPGEQVKKERLRRVVSVGRFTFTSVLKHQQLCHSSMPAPSVEMSTISYNPTAEAMDSLKPVEHAEDPDVLEGCMPAGVSAWVPACITKASLLQKVGAEVIGTFILVFTGCGAAMVDVKSNGAVTHLGVSAAFGLVVMIMIYSIGHISGAHMNPAVTLAFAAVRHFPWGHVPAYMGAQIVAGITAGFALRLIFSPVANNGATLPAGSDIQSFVLEIIITYILMFVVSAVATDTRAIGELAGLAVGSTVGLNAVFAGPISGASMNPARSIGPAIAANNYKSLWIYVVAPIVGALAGAWSYNMIRLQEKPGMGQSRSSKSFRR